MRRRTGITRRDGVCLMSTGGGWPRGVVRVGSEGEREREKERFVSCKQGKQHSTPTGKCRKRGVVRDQRGGGGGAVTGAAAAAAAAAAAVEAGGDGKEGEEKLYATFDGMSLGDGCGWGWGSQVECRIIIRVCWPVIWGSP